MKQLACKVVGLMNTKQFVLNSCRKLVACGCAIEIGPYKTVLRSEKVEAIYYSLHIKVRKIVKSH